MSRQELHRGLYYDSPEDDNENPFKMTKVSKSVADVMIEAANHFDLVEKGTEGKTKLDIRLIQGKIGDEFFD